MGPANVAPPCVLYTVQEGMHCWPGVELPATVRRTSAHPGGPHLSFKATPLIVDFFLSHPRQAGP